ncbi:hypothetical protein BJY01DRAFT_213395 [Aspergillus pseudoustus]|uniref:Anaphase-promoting complex subunit 13 n=1 Tax=Aspergillus pseudoustus TaxID=1810923 RepID=A0ABR4K2B0_9EURO
MDIDMDIDNREDETKNDTDNTIPPHFPIHELMHHRPQAPFVYFPEGPYFPAISDTLPSREASGGPATNFAIYEDTQDFTMDMDMDMDVGEEGEGEESWLVPTWYFSPEENKENTEEEHESEQRQQHEDGHFLLGSDGYDLPFAGMEPSYVRLSIEQRAYHNNAMVRPQGLANYESPPRRQDPLEGSSNFYQHIGLGDRPNNGFTRADNQHPVPSPSFLSATEISLQTLLGRASATESTPGLRSRRSRRTIRSLNIV